jgi:PAS domain S-box-containing protein
MQQFSRSVSKAYVLAVAAPAAVLLLLLTGSRFVDEAAVSLLFYSAIILAACYGGLKPGLLATTITGALAAFFFLRQLRWPWIDFADSWIDLLLLMGGGGLISWLSEIVHTSRRRGEAERHRLEQEIAERKKLQQVLEEQNEQIELAQQAGRVGLWSLDLETGRRRNSKGWLELMGYTVETQPKYYVEWLAQSVHPDDRARVDEAYQAIIRGERTDLDIEFRILVSKEGHRWVVARGRVMQPNSKSGLRLLGVTADITERRRVEEAVKEADRRKDEFLASLAHELRNPLPPIRNAVEIMRTLSPPEPRLQWCRDIIERQVEQMGRLMEDLLDVSRITHDRLKLRKEKVELSKILDRAIESSRPLIDEGEHEFNINIPSEQIWLDADPIRLVQVFSNLLNNAAKYTKLGGKIWLTVECQGSEVVITVKDNGIGIPEELLPEIFNMFTQGHHGAESMRGGLGLGLTLARSLVEMHGGTIEAKSDGENHGSEFVVRLKAADIAPRPVAKESPPLPQAGMGMCKRILIVEDSEEQAQTLAMVLELMGHQIRRARDGPSALEILNEFLPDVALVDLGLPGMSGYDLARRIREQPRLQHLVLVAQSGWGRKQDRQRARRAGFDHHLVKPFNLQRLNNLLSAQSS